MVMKTTIYTIGPPFLNRQVAERSKEEAFNKGTTRKLKADKPKHRKFIRLKRQSRKPTITPM